MNRIFEASIKDGSHSFDNMSMSELNEVDEVIRSRMATIVFHSSDMDASTFDDIQSFNLKRLIQVTAAKKRKSEEMKDADKEKS